MALTVTTIQNSKVIQEGLAELCKVKKGDFPKAIAIVSRLGEVFRSARELSPISQGRVSFIGEKIISILEEDHFKPDDRKAISIIVESANLKNALQIEALFLGIIYPKIYSHSKMASSPELVELRENLPEILNKITLTDNDLPSVFIDADPVLRYFNALIASTATFSTSDEFSVLMLLVFSNCKLEEGRFKIPISQLPSKTQLEPFLRSTNPDCKLIAQILYACLLEQECFNTFTSLTIGTEFLIGSLEQGDNRYAEILPFSEYLVKKNLIPLFASILEERDRCLAEGRTCKSMLYSSESLSRITPDMTEDWLQASADTYELIRKIELSLRNLFKSGELTPYEDPIRQATDPRLFNCISWIKSRVDTKGEAYKYPDPMTILKGSKDDFKILAWYEFWRTKKEKLTAAYEKSLTTPHNKSKPATTSLKTGEDDFTAAVAPSKVTGGKGKSKASRPAAAGGSASSCPKPLPPLEPEEEKVAILAATSGISGPKKGADKAISTPKTTPLQTTPSLPGISLHRRVSIWNESGAAGLHYYQYGRRDQQEILDPEEMILRHRFPPEILSILFNDRYSKVSVKQRDSGEPCTQWESVLEIDRKKYLLEATVDSKGILFHYYARPLRRFEDYFHLTREAPSEFPTLGETEAPPTPLPAVIAKGITLDGQGNAIFRFDGHNYKMLLLKMP